MKNKDLIQTLAEIEGFDDVTKFLDYLIGDPIGVSNGICPKCHYATEVEFCSTKGWCEECEANTVVHVAALLGMC